MPARQLSEVACASSLPSPDGHRRERRKAVTCSEKPPVPDYLSGAKTATARGRKAEEGGFRVKRKFIGRPRNTYKEFRSRPVSLLHRSSHQDSHDGGPASITSLQRPGPSDRPGGD